MLGVLEDIRDPRPSPLPMPRMRNPTKGKGAALPVVPTEVPQGEESDAAFAHWLQQEVQMAEVVRRGEDPVSLRTAQKLAAAEEEHLGVDAATLSIVEDELLIAKRMKKKKRWTIMGHLNYAGGEEEGYKSGGDKEPGSGGAASGAPPP